MRMEEVAYAPAGWSVARSRIAARAIARTTIPRNISRVCTKTFIDTLIHTRQE